MLPRSLAALAFCSPVLAGKGINGPGQPLTFRGDGTFQISIIEDLHYGEAPSSYGAVQDALTTKTIGKVLDSEPETDFVVINGDIISRDNVFSSNTTEYIDWMVEPLVDRNLTWASLYGNHDPGYNRSIEDMLAREHRYPNARTRSLVPDPQRLGATNYYLPVYAADCPSGCGCTPELLLWFFDSRSGFEYQALDASGARIERPKWVDAEVASWFEAENERIKTRYGKVIPALAFVHIPVDAFRAIQRGPGVDARRSPGMNDQEVTAQGEGFCADGVKNGTCAYGGQDVPFMRAVASAEGMLGMFSAHIHGVSWCYKWTSETMPEYPVQPAGEGLNICFGQRTGYGGNGNWMRGARNLLLSREGIAKGELDTWVRLESGDAVGAVSLNATFGQDEYPEVALQKTYCDECYVLGKPRSD